jgi:hypothetical protein
MMENGGCFGVYKTNTDFRELLIQNEISEVLRSKIQKCLNKDIQLIVDMIITQTGDTR